MSCIIQLHKPSVLLEEGESSIITIDLDSVTSITLILNEDIEGNTLLITTDSKRYYVEEGMEEIAKLEKQHR